MNTVGIVFLVLAILLVLGVVGWIVFVRWRAQRLGLPAPTWASFIPFRRAQPSPYGPATPAPGGITGWVNGQVRKFKNRTNARTAVGSYEGAAGVSGAGAGGARRGFGPLDPDEAWDSRVGTEAEAADAYGGYGYEEQELGLHPQHGGSSYQMNIAATPSLPGLDHTAAASPSGRNPFGDDDDGGDDDEGGFGRGRARSRSPGPAGPGAAPGLGVRGVGVGGGGGRNPFDDDADSSNVSLRGVSPRPINTAVPGSGKMVHGKKEGDSPTERRSIFRENV